MRDHDLDLPTNGIPSAAGTTGWLQQKKRRQREKATTTRTKNVKIGRQQLRLQSNTIIHAIDTHLCLSFHWLPHSSIHFIFSTPLSLLSSGCREVIHSSVKLYKNKTRNWYLHQISAAHSFWQKCNPIPPLLVQFGVQHQQQLLSSTLIFFHNNAIKVTSDHHITMSLFKLVSILIAVSSMSQLSTGQPRVSRSFVRGFLVGYAKGLQEGRQSPVVWVESKVSFHLLLHHRRSADGLTDVTWCYTSSTCLCVCVFCDWPVLCCFSLPLLCLPVSRQTYKHIIKHKHI